MGWGIGEPAGRLGAFVLGIVFCGVAIIATVDGVRSSSVPDVATGAAMLVVGLWIVATGIVGVPMQSGAFVGGGPILRRVSLAPDEPVIGHCWGSCEPERARLSSINMFFSRGQGEIFLTDRRIVLTSWRFYSWGPPTELPLRDIAEVRESPHANLGALGMPSLDLVSRAGLTYVFWFKDPVVATKLRAMLAGNHDFPEVERRTPRLMHTVGARILGGLSGFVTFTLLTFGRTSSPYVQGPRQPFLVFWVIFVAVTLYELVDFLRERRERRLIVR